MSVSNIDWAEIAQATLDTLTMLGGAMVLTVILGLPLGVILFLTGKGQMLANRAANGLLSLLVNILRSVPFVILLIVMIPLTVALVAPHWAWRARSRRWWSAPRRSSPVWSRPPCARSTRA